MHPKHKSYMDVPMLQLSGIQHYVFCPRQWALIYVEQVWEDNSLTVEGSLLHNNVDNPRIRKKNGSPVITLRAVDIASQTLGFNGRADAIELEPSSDSEGNYNITVIEYKRGCRKINDCDRMQVTAQTLALEEMLGISITHGAIFYWQERHREYFEITQELRHRLATILSEMHDLIRTGVTPVSHYTSKCRSCSLINLCNPKVLSFSAKNYIIKAQSCLTDEKAT